MTQRIHPYRKPKELSRLFWGMQIVFFLGCLLPISLIAELETINFGMGLIMAWGVILYSSIRLGMFTVRGEKRILSMTFWIYVYIFLGLVPTLQLTARQFSWEEHYMTGPIMLAFLAIFVGLFSYEIGKSLASSKFVDSFTFIRKSNAPRIIDSTRTLFFSIVAVVITTLLIIQLGGLVTILLPRHQRFIALMDFAQGDSQAKFQMVSALFRVPVFVGLLFLWSLWQSNKRKGFHYPHFNTLSKALFLILIVFNLLVNNPVNSARYWIGTIVFSFVFVSLRWHRQRSFGLWATLIILSFIFVFPFADLFRNTVSPGIRSLISSKTISEQLVKKGDYDSFQQIVNTVEYVEKHGKTRGQQIIGTLFFWIPRSMWIDKPIASGQLVAEDRGYEYTNLSLPLWAEAYLDGGLLGIFIVFSVYGFFTYRFEKWYLQCPQFDVRLLNVLIPVFAGYQIFILRGSLMSAFAYFVPILLFMLLMTKKRRLPLGRITSSENSPRSSVNKHSIIRTTNVIEKNHQ